MAKTFKKFLALALVLSLVMGMTGFAYAADEDILDDEPLPVEDATDVGYTPTEDGEKLETTFVTDEVAAEVTEAQTEVEKLKAAISAAEDGVETTITMTSDITGMTTAEIITIPAEKVIVLDMAEHSITVAENFVGRPFVNNGTLTVKGNGTIDSSMSESSGYGAINNKGTLVIENGHFAGAKYGDGSVIRNTGANAHLTVNGGLFDGALCSVYNEGTAVLKGGKYVSTSCSSCAAADGHSGKWSYALRNVTLDSKMYAYDGVEVVGTQGAISAAIGYLEVNGGTYKTVDCERNHGAIFYTLYAAGEQGEVRCVINDGTFETEGKNTAVSLGNDNTNGDGGINADAISLVYGGTFTAPEGVPALKVSPNTAKASILHGGTYSLLSEDTAAYVDPAVVGNAGTNVTLTSRTEDDEDALAKVGTAVYATLQAAINAAGEGDTVTLLKDAAENVTIANGQSITLNIPADVTLSGKANQPTIAVVKGGSLTTQGAGTITGLTNQPALRNRGTTTLSGVTVEAYAHTNYLIVNEGIMTISNATVNMSAGSQASMIHNGYVSYNRDYKSDTMHAFPEMTITNSKLACENDTAVKNDDGGVLTISGDTTEISSGNGFFSLVTAHRATINGGKFTGPIWFYGNGSDPNNGALTITDGEFYNQYGHNFQPCDNASCAYVQITGGTFGGICPLGNECTHAGAWTGIAAVAEHYTARDNNDGTWTVIPDTAYWKARIEETGALYTTLQAAINAATSGQTVTLLTDVENGSGVMLTEADAKDITIDLGGFTYNASEPYVGSTGTETQGFHFEQHNTVTLKNGTIASNAPMVIQNYCDLNLENLTITGGSDTGYIVSCNAGNTELTNVNISGTKDGVVALDVMHWHGRYPTAPTMTINNTNNTISGKIDVYCYGAGSDTCRSKATLAISGGTFTTKLEPDWCAEGYLPISNGDDTYGVTNENLTLTANTNPLNGGGTAIFTVTGVEGLTADIVVSDPSLTYTFVKGDTDRTWTVTLPNATAEYVFNVGIVRGDGIHNVNSGTIVTRYNAPYVPSTPSTPDEPDEPIVDIEDDETALGDRPFIFEDVHENDWFYDEVKNIFEHGLINGTTTTTYEPQTELTRGMIVTILWRIAGEPTVETTSTFTDVPENAYYFDAINWGAANNIARGYDEETFAPDRLVSREELAALIYRYAELVELDLTGIDDEAFAEFDDAETVLPWFVENMKWAISAGIVKGDNGMLLPQDRATRAEAAAMVNRFIQIPEIAAVMQANAEAETTTDAE